jgi:hypothetical protein
MAIGAASITEAIRSMNTQNLNALKDLIAQEESNRKAEIKNMYGEWFCNIVGIENIYSLTQVEAKDLNLEGNSKYFQDTVKPSMLKEPAVRGIMGNNRPFVAIKLEMLDSETKKVMHVVVEVIFKRYPLTGDGGKGCQHENNYVTTLSNLTEKEVKVSSYLYSSGSMRDQHIMALKDLLEGKTVRAPVGDSFIRKATN